jgi:hypothetical protein
VPSRRPLLFTVLVLSVAGTSIALAAEAKAPQSRQGIARCFKAHRVLVDAGGSFYFPSSVEVRSRQMALSFALIPSEAGLQGMVFLEPNPRAAAAVLRRAISYAVRTGGGNAQIYRRYGEVHGTKVLGWQGGLPTRAARDIAVKCLGPRTS